MKSSRKVGGFYSTKHAGVLLGVDAIYLGEALDTVDRFFCHVGHTTFQMYSLSLSPSTKLIFPKTLGVKVLRHPVPIFPDTKNGSATVQAEGLGFFPCCWT